MRPAALLAVALALATAPASAQAPNSVTGTPGTTAGAGSTAPEATGAPAPGANSFTEAQARARMESAGYSGITDLRQDDQGIWRGMAVKDGKPAAVALDFRGAVTGQ